MNEYRQSILAHKRQWIGANYDALIAAGKVSTQIAKWIDGAGGIQGMKEDYLDSFGDLVCRTLEKIAREQGASND